MANGPVITQENISKQIALLMEQRDELQKDAERKLSFLNGKIEALRELIAPPPPPPALAVVPGTEGAPQT